MLIQLLHQCFCCQVIAHDGTHVLPLKSCSNDRNSIQILLNYNFIIIFLPRRNLPGSYGFRRKACFRIPRLLLKSFILNFSIAFFKLKSLQLPVLKDLLYSDYRIQSFVQSMFTTYSYYPARASLQIL